MKLFSTVVGVTATALVVAAAPAHAADLPVLAPQSFGDFSVQTRYFDVAVGPDRDQHCTVVGDIYVPTALGPNNRAPAILTSNGFGGSKDDQAGAAARFATHGYVVLSYSALGFGGSTCKIFFADPDYDGMAASDLIGYLAGDSEGVFTDAALSVEAPVLDVVRLDAPQDPRVGYLGGSYAGATGLAAASVDSRLDTVASMITWNDLARSLAPDGAGRRSVGPVKSVFGSAFLAAGAILTGPGGYAADPARAQGCPNYAQWVCDAASAFAANREPDPGTLAAMRHVSPVDYLDRVDVPVLLTQGQKDSLFSLDEAAATFETLRARGVETSMVWHSWGHNDRKGYPGEFDIKAPDPFNQHEAALVGNWLDRHLKDRDVDPGPAFTYFRDWVPYSGVASPAYEESDTFPVGARRTFAVADGTLSEGVASNDAWIQTIRDAGSPVHTTVGLPNIAAEVPVPRVSLPGSAATWTTAPLAEPVDVVGAPELSISPTTSGPATVFVTVLDVAPNGARSPIHGLVAPAVLTGSAEPVTISLPSIVHRFDRGHRIGVDITASDPSFAGGPGPADVTFSSTDPINQFSLPTVPMNSVP
ncbi:CocE/NonD family hydrolase [Rhodococcus cercidiphylli]|uniref:CocE/NonD family hydrolase n=1 Tax=Rhodococcus cercidiphylli TaxID=489916 RepID=A0ABU4AY12_9NOCA|nr:CocE/NonD family hydrolase [Rhodococcus cercidiphylli]MDV6231125.1 CocE/NonD family hydrolase [Rhodococcus cercidiphylli]